MKHLIDTYNKTRKLHHAYLIQRSDTTLSDIQKLFSIVTKKEVSQNSDFYHFDVHSFGINDAREIKKLQSQAPQGPAQFFILEFTTITGEAQNALLKVFEEPSQNTHFFVCIANTEILLPTVQSRMISLFQTHREVNSELAKMGKEFLNEDMANRLTVVKKISDSKDVGEALKLLDAIEENLYQNKKEKKEHLFLNLIRARKHIQNKEGSMKMLLEEIALTV